MNAKQRDAGMLLHITSLPSDGGIGCIDEYAYKFVDILHQTQTKYWQILPVNYPLLHGCPYNCKSAFALNPLFIDIKAFLKYDLLSNDDIDVLKNVTNTDCVDFIIVDEVKNLLIHKAYTNLQNSNHKDLLINELQVFKIHNAFWLNDFALFEALKKHFNNVSWNEWDKDIRFREPNAMKHYSKLLQNQIEYEVFVQYFAFIQLNALKNYANTKGVKIIGDIPIYVSYDSADVWSHPEMFLLNKELLPKKIAGVPPDAFSLDGQLWGNPIYNWNFHKKNNYSWWKQRLAYLQHFSNIVRIDHFIGFVKYYEVDAGAKTAREGKWQKGPGITLFESLNKQIPKLHLIAEDLGSKTVEVDNLLKQLNILGNRVFQFGFPVSIGNEHSPFNVERNVVYYTSTHDNNTLKGWIKSNSEEVIQNLNEYFDATEENLIEKIIINCWQSNATIVIVPMQDVLELDENARMNLPGTIDGNWKWRLSKDDLENNKVLKIKKYNKLFCREAK